jgi:hypothetical protein
MYTNEPLRAGVAPTRIVIGYERVIFYNETVGVRLGYAFAGEGKTPRGGLAFVPFSAEIRAAYWFGNDPFVQQRIRPFAFVNAGYGMFDVHTSAHVREDPLTGLDQGGNDLEQELDVWKRAGDAYVGLGGGALFMLSDGFGISAETSVLQVFPFGATVIQPALGARMGF